jgi:putative membrane protein
MKYTACAVIVWLVTMFVSCASAASIFSILLLTTVLILANLLLRPLILVVALPANLLTFGICGSIVNTWMLMLADKIVPGITLGGFWPCFGAAIIFGFAEAVINSTRR